MTNEAAPSLQRDSTFWFFDGNIILQAQNGVIFRVHRGVLAFHSEFFNAMFDQSLPIPHGFDEDSTIDDCPVIPLEDTAYDVRQLLLVIYGKNSLEDTTFSVLAALVRVGHKYGMHDVVSKCAPYLRKMVPVSLHEYEEASEHREDLQFTLQNAPEALHVFRLIDLGDDGPFILPFMLFLCAQLRDTQIRDGCTREDGTPEKLSDADVGRILPLKRELQRRGEQALRIILHFEGPSGYCDRVRNKRYDDCEWGYLLFFEDMPTSVRNAYKRGDIFGTWAINRMQDSLYGDIPSPVCRDCLRPHIEGLEKLRQETWAALPKLAGIME